MVITQLTGSTECDISPCKKDFIVSCISLLLINYGLLSFKRFDHSTIWTSSGKYYLIKNYSLT